MMISKMDNVEIIIANESMIESLTNLRIEVLIAANKLNPDTDLSEVYKNTMEYYERSFRNNTNITVLAMYNNLIIGCGSVSFFNVMPTCCNKSGKKAYIMNMYVKSEHRRKGVASMILTKLIKLIKEKGEYVISLEATEMGLPLYEKFGFEKLESEMELPHEKLQEFE